MQLKQANTLLVASMVVVAVIVLAACYLIYNGISLSDDAKMERDDNYANFERTFRKADPFPNEENIKRMGENIEVMAGGYDRLLADLGEGVTLAPVATDAEFGRRREQVLSELTTAAPVGHSGTRIIPADFMFGFDSYRDGHAASLETIPRLLLQLDIINAIVREMYASDILALTSVTREVFEGDAQTTEDQEESGGRRGRRRGRSRDDESSASEGSSDPTGDLTDIDVPLNRQKFRFAFDAKEEAVISLLNRLAAMPMYVAVTRLEFEKAGADVASAAPERGSSSPRERRSPQRSRRFGSRQESNAPAPEEAEAEAAPSGRLARLFSGRNLESPVHVQLDVEVYNIHRPVAETAATETEE